MSGVVLSNVTVSYQRRPAVHHVSGRFESGVATAIVGPMAQGKVRCSRRWLVFYQSIAVRCA